MAVNNSAIVTANSINWFVSAGNTFIQGDVDGNGIADFANMLSGVDALTGLGAGSDFVL